MFIHRQMTPFWQRLITTGKSCLTTTIADLDIHEGIHTLINYIRICRSEKANLSISMPSCLNTMDKTDGSLKQLSQTTSKSHPINAPEDSVHMTGGRTEGSELLCGVLLMYWFWLRLSQVSLCYIQVHESMTVNSSVYKPRLELPHIIIFIVHTYMNSARYCRLMGSGFFHSKYSHFSSIYNADPLQPIVIVSKINKTARQWQHQATRQGTLTCSAMPWIQTG